MKQKTPEATLPVPLSSLEGQADETSGVTDALLT